MKPHRLLLTVLWFLVGMLATTTAARFILGLGATTALNDASPWGLWIAFDVMSGVALAAGGFVVAAAVHIFDMGHYKSLARPAILTAFLGYAAVAVSLLYDLGIPLHIWHPLIYPQPHSVLFEVAMCVMLYLTVLFLEFCPVMLEHPCASLPLLKRIHTLLKKLTVPLVIAGIVLSTLHQSSLGSLFLIAPHRVHPLWYSPWIWVFFLFSAIGLGAAVVILESLFSEWYFGHQVRLDLLGGLARAGSWALAGYVCLRVTDLLVRTPVAVLFQQDWRMLLFLLEMLLILLPCTFLQFRRIRRSRTGLGLSAASILLGVLGYRFNVSLVAFSRPEGMSYFPSWTELVVTLGLVAACLLIFIFFVRHFRVFSEDSDQGGPEAASADARHPLSVRSLLPESLAAMERASLAFVLGACLALSFLAYRIDQDTLLTENPVSRPIVLSTNPHSPLDASTVSPHLRKRVTQIFNESASKRISVIDGNRNGRLVPFDHLAHEERLGSSNSCPRCHHFSPPMRAESSCSECHSDMYLEKDLFSHVRHIGRLRGNESCVRCHPAEEAKTRSSAESCQSCHRGFRQESDLISLSPSPEPGIASSYMQAMHGLCIKCHQKMTTEDPVKYPRSFAECGHCHIDTSPDYVFLLEPYPVEGGI